MVEAERIELSKKPCKGFSFPLAYAPLENSAIKYKNWYPLTDSNRREMITNEALLKIELSSFSLCLYYTYINFKLEHYARIELASLLWKSKVLPLNE